jgi:hypothetical protein
MLLTKYKVYDIIGHLAMTLDQGKKVYDVVHPELLADRSVELDFAGVEIYSGVFFNFAIGNLYEDIPPEKIEKLLTFSNLDDVGAQGLKLSMEDSQEYFGDENVRQVINQIFQEQSDNP